jgi:hypothetical protein
MLKYAFCIFLAFAATTASAQDVVVTTINACLEAAPADQNLIERMERLGWSQIPNRDLGEGDFRAIAAIGLADRMAYGRVPAVRWQSDWERSLETAAGHTRRVNVPDAVSLTFWLGRADSENLLRIKFEKHPAFGRTQCDMSTTEAISRSSLQPQIEFGVTPEMRPIIAKRTQRFENDNAVQRVFIHLYQKEMIADLIGDTFEFNGRVSVLTHSKR